jgi:hypothetical protein
MTERVHGWFAAGAVVSLAVGFLGWRSVGSAAPVTPAAPVPNPGLSALTPFAAPIADTFVVQRPMVDGVVLRRDPFVPQAVPRVATLPVEPTAPQIPVTVDGTKWIVSATLIGGARRAAIINDELFHVGDSLPGGMKLTSVERDRVVLTDSRGTAHTIAVKEGEG